MNKRIKELMNEAFSDIMVVDQLEDHHFEKFANLIILECCDQVGYLDAIDDVKKHFGMNDEQTN